MGVPFLPTLGTTACFFHFQFVFTANIACCLPFVLKAILSSMVSPSSVLTIIYPNAMWWYVSEKHDPSCPRTKQETDN